MKYTTRIRYNGSRFAGDKHASLETLLKLMGVEPLNFTLTRFSVTREGLTALSGNFERVAHAFHIESNDPEVLTALADHVDMNRRIARARTYSPEVSPRALELIFRKEITPYTG